MKKLFIIICALFVGIANADNVITSKEYVDTVGAALQQQVPAKNTNTVLTYPAASTDAPGEKAIYDASAAYGTQTDALVTAGQFNNALQVALDTEFVCVSRNDQGCLLYEIRSAVGPQQIANEYTRLEYLTGAGTEYIITDIPWHSVKRFRGRAQQTSVMDNINKAVVGSSATGTGNAYEWMWGTLAGGNQQDGWYWYTGISQLTAANFDIAQESSGIWQGTVNQTVTRGVSDFAGNVVIMGNYDPYAGYSSNYTRRAFNGLLWYIQLFDANNNLLFDGQPVRQNSDGKVGLYDTVSHAFFASTSQTDFTAGPVLYLPGSN